MRKFSSKFDWASESIIWANLERHERREWKGSEEEKNWRGEEAIII